MSETPWWEPHLQKWADTIQVSYRIDRYETAKVRREIGDWWKNGAHWSAHLDELHYASFDAEEQQLDARVRNTFTWVMKTVAATRHPDWRSIVANWVWESDALDDAQLTSAFFTANCLPIGTAMAEPLPGYLVWLHFTKTQVQSVTSFDDLQTAVDEIIEAYQPVSVVGWMPPVDGMKSLLLFWPLEQDASPAEADDLERSTRSGSSRIRAAIEELLQIVAADALVSTKAVVSQPIYEVNELYRAAVTVVSMSHYQRSDGQSGRISIWGDVPLSTLLQAISPDAARLFIEAAVLRASDAAVKLTPDLEEALNGLVAGNLNVSEASRLLYLHRNTLMNRIERIRQQTGYDVRHFEDAVVLWMVNALQKRIDK